MESITMQIGDWVKTTKALAEVPEPIFKSFRTLPIFYNVIEGTTFEGGANLLSRLKRNHFFINALDLIRTSENFKSSCILKQSIDNKNVDISPTTARYCNNTLNLINIFGLKSLKGNIVEIGGGYGGECKIIQDFGVALTAIPKSYVILDLPTSIGLIRRYLGTFGYDKSVEIKSEINHMVNEIDLVISNGAFSEMDRELQ